MENLDQQIQRFNTLVQKGNRLKAMEIFYSDEFRTDKLSGESGNIKQNCLTREKENMKMVSRFKTNLKSQAIDYNNQVVFSEWQISFVDTEGELVSMLEVSVQKWKSGKIIKENFNYKEIPSLKEESVLESYAMAGNY